MEFLGDDYREDRVEVKQNVVKKHIPLKLKSSSNLNQLPASQPNISTSYSNQNANRTQNSTQSTTINIETTSQNNPIAQTADYQNAKRDHIVSSMNWQMNLNTDQVQKIVGQRMDYCQICSLPILVYGRLIPCKHVMCIQCANSIDLKTCLKESCHENIEKIETVLRENIFVCSYDSELCNVEQLRMQPDVSQRKYCGRGYMSERDLQAHIKHRHELS